LDPPFDRLGHFACAPLVSVATVVVDELSQLAIALSLQRGKFAAPARQCNVGGLRFTALPIP
jgi:hypothetical protein